MIGILLTNTGTPDAPNAKAVRRYLREFLSDRRVVQIPRMIWLPILHGLVLPFRAPKSAALYQEIWTEQGSPMRVHLENLRNKLDEQINTLMPGRYGVALGMNYGNPSIKTGLKKLRDMGAEKIIVLPLFPQFSNTSTASSFDRLERPLTNREMTLVHNYHDHDAYTDALAKSVKTHWQQHGKGQHLLISFHGIPERFAAQGDPYPAHCEQTAKLLAEALRLTTDQWTLCYQSQFGYDKWLKPSTQALFTELPRRNIKRLDIICPGFAVDCLETLEEIESQGKKSFLTAGGESLRYIPALNASELHTNALTRIIKDTLSTLV